MNWYKISEYSGLIRSKLKRIEDDYSDDGTFIWTKGNNVFVSMSDSAENIDEVISKIKKHLISGGRVRVEAEVANPGAGWVRV